MKGRDKEQGRRSAIYKVICGPDHVFDVNHTLCIISNEAPWCVDSPADIHLSDNVLLVLKQKKKNQF